MGDIIVQIMDILFAVYRTIHPLGTIIYLALRNQLRGLTVLIILLFGN